MVFRKTDLGPPHGVFGRTIWLQGTQSSEGHRVSLFKDESRTFERLSFYAIWPKGHGNSWGRIGTGFVRAVTPKGKSPIGRNGTRIVRISSVPISSMLKCTLALSALNTLSKVLSRASVRLFSNLEICAFCSPTRRPSSLLGQIARQTHAAQRSSQQVEFQFIVKGGTRRRAQRRLSQFLPITPSPKRLVFVYRNGYRARLETVSAFGGAAAKTLRGTGLGCSTTTLGRLFRELTFRTF